MQTAVAGVAICTAPPLSSQLFQSSTLHPSRVSSVIVLFAASLTQLPPIGANGFRRLRRLWRTSCQDKVD